MEIMTLDSFTVKGEVYSFTYEALESNGLYLIMKITKSEGNLIPELEIYKAYDNKQDMLLMFITLRINFLTAPDFQVI